VRAHAFFAGGRQVCAPISRGSNILCCILHRDGVGKQHPCVVLIAVPDLISNSYFPAVAAVELGCMRDEGIDATVQLLFPVDAAYRALAAGDVDLVAGSAHSALAAFPKWRGVKLLAAQAQGMYWFLVMRSDIDAGRNDVSVVRGRRIGAAPWVDLGLEQLISDAGLSLDEVDIAPVPGAAGAGTNFGLAAARALDDGTIDGFWANGLGTETALRSGAGRLVLDVRRGDGPDGCFDYTFASLAATDGFVAADIARAQAVVRALRRAQGLLAEDPERATEIGERVFPPVQAALIAELVRRDAPFYDAEISERAVTGMNRFARERGLLEGDPAYEEIVATDVDRS
jgi:ABC-type nitrate/sulfonate/bicarbonate transport system substrate-binding protein